MLLVAEIREWLSIIALDAGEYVRTLEKSAALGISGGSIYDALLAACAIKADAETIYSWNMRHYSMPGPEVAVRLRRP